MKTVQDHALHPEIHVSDSVLVVRFSLWARLTHIVLALSVSGLILTGMPLKYNTAPWAWPLTRLWGGARNAGLIHRGFAIGLGAAGVMHIAGVLVALARRRLPPVAGPDGILPHPNDLKDLVGYLRHLRGRGPRPEFGKFTYWERFDYVAEIWGTLVFGLSGLVMWFPQIALRWVPGWAVNAALIMHSNEALLATGFLFAIHFFNTHLRPEVFPVEPVIFMGRQTLEHVKEERPGWYERILVGERAKILTGKDSPPPRLVRIGAIAFLTIGTVTLLAVMSAAIGETVRYLIEAVR